MFFYRLFVLLLFAMKKISALQCYSCGDENSSLGEEYSTTLPCSDFDKADDLGPFIIECPEEFVGCITQTKDTEITRTCDTVAVDDCETANGINYCYCSSDLCNGKQTQMETRKSSRDIALNYPGDDEDYVDMSGQGNIIDIDGSLDDAKNSNGGGRRYYKNNSSHEFSNKQLILLSLSLSILLKILFKSLIN